ncbi:MAG: hypothetical protein V2A73_11425 [Pseudomonadota bacterium]
MRPSRYVSLSAFIALVLLTSVAGAQTPKPAPAPTPAPTSAPAEDLSDQAAAVTAEQPTGTAKPASVASAEPASIRLRQLEQKIQELKEKSWRVKARVDLLKEAALGGGIGARVGIAHENRMGSAFRLVKLVYALDGVQVYSRSDTTGALDDLKKTDILSGPIEPGNHTLSLLMVYNGQGYGLFSYMKGYKFTVRSSHTFTATEGKLTQISALGYERGGVDTPMEKRPAVEFKVNVVSGAPSKGK